jgi:hypothetical protein
MPEYKLLTTKKQCAKVFFYGAGGIKAYPRSGKHPNFGVNIK